MKRTLSTVLCLLLLCALLSCGTLAANVRIDNASVYCFSSADFVSAARGVYLDAVPAAALGSVRYGSRVLCAGDVLPAAAASAPLPLSPPVLPSLSAGWSGWGSTHTVPSS